MLSQIKTYILCKNRALEVYTRVIEKTVKKDLSTTLKKKHEISNHHLDWACIQLLLICVQIIYPNESSNL